MFAISQNIDEHGGGLYKCIGYDVWAATKAFNGTDHMLYDMHFMLFGRGKGMKNTIAFSHSRNYLFLGDTKETVSDYIEALEYITPTVSGNTQVYTEHANIDGANVILNLNFYNDVLAGFDYEYDNLEVAYKHAESLHRDLELTFGEKPTYPGAVHTNKDYFDNITDVSELKNNFTYYEDWTAAFDYDKKENIDKMLKDKKYSRIDIHFELSVINESKAMLSVRYIALP